VPVLKRPASRRELVLLVGVVIGLVVIVGGAFLIVSQSVGAGNSAVNCGSVLVPTSGGTGPSKHACAKAHETSETYAASIVAGAILVLLSLAIAQRRANRRLPGGTP
jgi:hypothetical protein